MRCPCSANDDILYEHGFDDSGTRRKFITKVCCIVGLQMIYTGIVTSLFMFCDNWGDWLKENSWLFLVAAGINLSIALLMCYCLYLFRQVPCNYIILIIFTTCKSIIISYICVQYAPRLVLYAIGATASLCFVLALFALFAPCDFTTCWPLVLIALLCLMIAAIFFFIFPGRILYTVIVCAAIIIFSVVLVIDIQMIIGGRHSAKFDENDYVIASIAIYTDIIQLFICILQLFGLLEGD